MSCLARRRHTPCAGSSRGASDALPSLMALVFDILKWTGIVAAGFAVAGMLLVGLLAWLLNLPIDEDDPGRNAGRC